MEVQYNNKYDYFYCVSNRIAIKSLHNNKMVNCVCVCVTLLSANLYCHISNDSLTTELINDLNIFDTIN